ncbi:MAG: thiamine-phosphate pyrophosphorylase [Candidatus Omnitrophica bacterium]|nr:thiamine-phosphate pyrophosphorylase [Candidatus Omnitrophota bacterium]
MLDKGVLRVIDANYNRFKEGLRVAEDIFRFVLEDDSCREKIRVLRHGFDDIVKDNFLKEGILTRDSESDLGRRTDSLELRRDNVFDLVYINLQRAKESLRVLEELFKIVLPVKVSQLKSMRYQIYTLEKEILVAYPEKFKIKQ